MDAAWVDLYWLPLGAGGHCVRWNGRLYERLVAVREHRRPADLFHSALKIAWEGTTYAVEMGPVWNVSAADRGVVCEGAVGARRLGSMRAFRYEVRCWPGGDIPDVIQAVGAPHRVSHNRRQAAAVLQVLRQVPPLTWGRDELGTGDMWNSNSVVSWVLARTGHDVREIVPPHHGRAPGWFAGQVLADRQRALPQPQAPLGQGPPRWRERTPDRLTGR
jgi:hypothetical protein